MIHDGYWQGDLVALANKITYWQRRVNKLIMQGVGYQQSEFAKAEHQLTQSIFYSACIVRKIIEEENEAIRGIARCTDMFPTEKPNNCYEHYKLHCKTIRAYQMPLKVDAANCFDDYCHEDYDFSKAKETQHDIKSISNWIMHSYVWFLGSIVAEDQCVYGFIISSDYDKAKYSCYIPIDGWCCMLKYAAENAYL